MIDKLMKHYPVMSCQCGATYRARTIRDLACCPACAIRQEEAEIKAICHNSWTLEDKLLKEQARDRG